jgi:hypothetical protein
MRSSPLKEREHPHKNKDGPPARPSEPHLTDALRAIEGTIRKLTNEIERPRAIFSRRNVELELQFARRHRAYLASMLGSEKDSISTR